MPYVGQNRKGKSSQVDAPLAHDLAAADEPSPSSSNRPAPATKDCNETIVGFRAVKGFGRIFKAAARAPGTFTVAMAQGAHNAPRMWGDKTVRRQDKITGVVSGVTAGCKVGHCLARVAWLSIFMVPSEPASVLTCGVASVQELALGTYDGIAGLVTQPVIGAMEEGPLGFVKGFGKGVMGAPFKAWAGKSAISPFSMTLFLPVARLIE